MKYLKNLFFIITSYILSINLVFGVGNDIIKEGLKKQDNIIMDGASAEYSGGINVLDFVFSYIKDSLNGLLMITVVGVFLYLGIKLVLARGNPEEFKKTMMHFVYVAIGIFTVSVAYAIVKMVSGINLF